MTNRVLVLLVQNVCDIIRIAHDMESNIVMTIRKYEGLYDDILVAVHEELYQKPWSSSMELSTRQRSS